MAQELRRLFKVPGAKSRARASAASFVPVTPCYSDETVFSMPCPALVAEVSDLIALDRYAWEVEYHLRLCHLPARAMHSRRWSAIRGED
jgi:hypothetical protein